MNNWFFLVPFLGAIIGWCLNKMAVKMLFYPEKPKKFMGLTFQGYISRRRAALAKEIGQYAEEVFATFNLEDKISNPSNLQKAMPMIEGHVDDFLRNKLKEQMPMLTMFIGEKTIQTLKSVFLKELEVLFPAIMIQFATNLKNELSIEQLIVSRLIEIPVSEIERRASKQLNAIIWAGAITGFLVGSLQLIMVLLTN
jgi:uncharacterized membrane protein YheB (UPF0754 family)